MKITATQYAKTLFELTVKVHPVTKNIVFQSDLEQPESLPKWTELSYHQCSHCPYNQNQKKHCPVAANISHVVGAFKETMSYTVTHVTVIGPDRKYEKTTDLQVALQSLLGLLMAGSDCSHFDFLKNLVPTHLPFSTIEETMNRILGSELNKYIQLAKSDAEFSKLTIDKISNSIKNNYEPISLVNTFLMERITSITKEGESIQNAIIILSVFSDLIPIESAS